MDEDLVDLVHNGVSLFRAEPLHKRRKSLYVAEHHCDLLAFTFDFSLLGQDFFCEALWKVALNLVQFVIKRKIFGGWFSGKG
ncbi:MAG: hypothetical protein ABIE47_12225 [Pseudomonadota bacterium]